MRLTCRVPLQLLALRLSILYLRTCVGLGYGSLFLPTLTYVISNPFSFKNGGFINKERGNKFIFIFTIVFILFFSYFYY